MFVIVVTLSFVASTLADTACYPQSAIVGPPILGMCPTSPIVTLLTTAGDCCPQANFATVTTTTTTTTTTTKPCVDLLNPSTGRSDCPGMAAYCTNSLYLSLMQTQCPKTCGFCGTTSGSCVDLLNPSTGKSDCPGLASYCTNPAYVSLMKTQCPKTCGYCSG